MAGNDPGLQGCPLTPIQGTFMSDVDLEEGTPGAKLSHPTVRRGGYPLPANLTLLQRGGLSKDPPFCRGDLNSALPSPGQLLPAVYSLFSGPQPSLLERQEASN